MCILVIASEPKYAISELCWHQATPPPTPCCTALEHCCVTWHEPEAGVSLQVAWQSLTVAQAKGKLELTQDSSSYVSRHNTYLHSGLSLAVVSAGKGMHSRLYTRVLNQFPWMVNCTAISSLYNETGIFSIFASAESASADEMVSVLCKELQVCQLALHPALPALPVCLLCIAPLPVVVCLFFYCMSLTGLACPSSFLCLSVCLLCAALRCPALPCCLFFYVMTQSCLACPFVTLDAPNKTCPTQGPLSFIRALFEPHGATQLSLSWLACVACYTPPVLLCQVFC